MINYQDKVLEEIALEGLEGITLQTLWVRLKFSLNFENIRDQFKEYCWQIICLSKQVDFYELPTARADFQLIDRNWITKQKLLENYDYPIDLYSKIVPIVNKKERGSCPDYRVRQVIPVDKIQSLSLGQVIEKYGSKLVIVASQSLRSNILSEGMFPHLFMSLGVEYYCILERIARSRTAGEASIGPHSLRTIYNDVMPHYLLQPFLENDVVVQQSYFYGRLYHLKRFQTVFLSKNGENLKTLVEELKTAPDSMVVASDFKKKYNMEIVSAKKFKFPKEIVTEYKPIAETLLPNDEYADDENQRSKVVKTYRLLDPNFNIYAWFMNRNCAKDEENDEFEDDDDDAENETVRSDSMMTNTSNQICQNRDRISTLVQICRDHEDKGGASVSDIASAMQLDTKSVNRLTKVLISWSVLDVKKEDVGKCRKFRFSLKHKNNGNKTAVEKKVASKSAAKIPKKKAPIKPIETTQSPKYMLMEMVKTDEEFQIKYHIAMRSIRSNILDEKHQQTLLQSYFVTESVKFRLNLILEYLQEKKVFLSTQEVSQYIHAKGDKYVVDRSVIRKMLSNLSEIKYVNIFDLRFFACNGRSVSPKITLYAKPETNLKSECVQNEVRQLKMQFVSKGKQWSTVDKCGNMSLEPQPRYQLFSDLEFQKSLKFQNKHLRNKLLHKFLYCLVYRNECDTSDADDFDFDMDMAVPKFNFSIQDTPGTILLSTLIYHMPLILIPQLVLVNQYVSEFKEYIEDATKALTLFKNLPTSIISMYRNQKEFVLRKKILEGIQTLASFGLLQISKYLRTDYVIYVNKNISIKDTRTNANKLISFHLNALEDIESYWSKLKEVALSKESFKSNSVKIKEVSKQNKKSFSAKYAKNLNEFHGNDTGLIPGDGKGVAGMDSTIFMQHFRSWAMKNEWTFENAYKTKIISTNAYVIRKNVPSADSRKQYRLKILNQHKQSMRFRQKFKLKDSEYNALLLCHLVGIYFCIDYMNISNRLFLKKVLQQQVPSFKKNTIKIFTKKLYFALERSPLNSEKLEAAVAILRSNDSITDEFFNDKTEDFKLLFEDLYGYLYHHYRSIDNIIMENKELDLADCESIDDLRLGYEIIDCDANIAISDNYTLYDMQFSTLQSVIMSKLLSQMDRINNSVQLNAILRKYKMKLKKDVSDCLRKLQVIIGDKKIKSKFPYSISNHFWTVLKFKYSPEYFYSIYLSIKEFLDEERYVDDGPRLKRFKFNDTAMTVVKNCDLFWNDFRCELSSANDFDLSSINCDNKYKDISEFVSRMDIDCLFKDKRLTMADVDAAREKSTIHLEKIKNAYFVRTSDQKSDVDVLQTIAKKHKMKLSHLNEIVNFIKIKSFNGASAEHLKQELGSQLKNVPNQQLLRYLDVLVTEAKFIIETGIDYQVYVHYENAEPWTISTTHLTRLEREKMIGSSDLQVPKTNQVLGSTITLLIAPWIRLDGSFNRRVFDHFVCMLLNHCLLKRSVISFKTLAKQVLFLTPVQVFGLLKFLRDIECITLTTSLPELFFANEKPTDNLDDFQNIFIEVMPSYEFNMACFLSTKQYSNFLKQ